MKEEIMEHMKNLKEQGINVRVDEDRINGLINKISDKKKEEKNTYIDFKKDKFLEKYGDKNIYISYDKSRFNTEEINKSLSRLRKKFINSGEFTKEHNKFMDNVEGFENYKAKKKPGSVSPNQKK